MTSFSLNHCTLFCRDLPSSLEFYTSILGIKPLQIDQAKGFAILNTGPCRLILMGKRTQKHRGSSAKATISGGLTLLRKLFKKEKQKKKMTEDGDTNTLTEEHSAISLNCEDVEAVYHELISKGLAFADYPTRQDWGGIRVSLRDPDGHLIYLVSSQRR